MKTSDFARCLTAFFESYLPGIRNLSENTIKSYRDALRLLLVFCRDVCKISPERLDFKKLDDELVIQFLNWLESERGCSVSTRNQRLVAIHAFFRFASVQEPENMCLCQRILQIPYKKYTQPIIQHLSPEQTRALLATPDPAKKSGRRDRVLLSVLYDTGSRVQELCDLRVRDTRLDQPSVITVTGKGGKTRFVPITNNTTELLGSYMMENRLDRRTCPDAPLFTNQKGAKLTRGGVSHILSKHAAASLDETQKKITPHVLRHSKSMHLYQAGINLVYIRDFLGHVDISTTDVYARADTEMKRKQLENAYPDITPEPLMDWRHDEDLLSFLNSF